MATRNRRPTERRINIEKRTKRVFEELNTKCIKLARNSKERSKVLDFLKTRRSFFDWGFWRAANEIYENSSGINSAMYKIVLDMAFKIHKTCPDNIDLFISSSLKSGLMPLHIALSYFVSAGFIDAPKKVLIKYKLYDWAAAVEEGRGSTTNWRSVIELYALSGSKGHLRRLMREIPKRAPCQNLPLKKDEVKTLLTLIKERLEG